MGDDDEQPEEQPMMLTPFGAVALPPEMQAKIQHQQDQAQMAGEVWRHEVRDFLTTLSPEHLTVLRRMLDNISESEDPCRLADYWQGMVTVVMEMNHGICMGCGKNHDEDLAAVGQEKIGDGDGAG